MRRAAARRMAPRTGKPPRRAAPDLALARRRRRNPPDGGSLRRRLLARPSPACGLDSVAMNAERLHAVASELKEDFEATTVPALLDQLTTQLNTWPRTPPTCR